MGILTISTVNSEVQDESSGWKIVELISKIKLQ